MKCNLLLLLFCVSFLFSNAQEPNLMLPTGGFRNYGNLAISKDEKYLALVKFNLSETQKLTINFGESNTIQIWNLPEERLLYEIQPHFSNIESLHFDKTGRFLITAGSDNSSKLIDISTKKIIHQFKGVENLSYSNFSNDGLFIYTFEYKKGIKIYNASNFEETSKINGSIIEVIDNQLNNYILVLYDNNTAKVWDISTGKLIVSPKVDTTFLYAANFSDNGDKVILKKSPNIIEVYDIKNNNNVFSYKAQSKMNFYNKKDYVNPFSKRRNFYRDEVVTIDSDKSIVINNAKNENDSLAEICVYNLSNKNLLFCLEDSIYKTDQNSKPFISFDKTIIVTSGYSTCNDNYYSLIWNAKNGKLINKFEGIPLLSLDRKYLLINTYINQKPILIRLDNLSKIDFGKRLKPTTSIRFNDEGNLLYTCSSTGTFVWGNNNCLLRSLQNKLLNENYTYLSNSNNYVINEQYDGSTEVFDLVTNQKISDYKLDFKTTKSPSLKKENLIDYRVKFEDAEKSKSIIVYNCLTGEKVINIKLSINEIMEYYSIVNNNTTIITQIRTRRNNQGEFKSRICFFDIKTGNLLKQFLNSTDILLTILGKDKFVTTSTGYITIKDIKWNTLYKFQENYESSINTVIISPDEKFLLIGYGDGTLKIRDIMNGKLINTLKGHSIGINALTYSPDGKYIVSASGDNTLKKWNAITGEFLYTFFAIDSTDYLIIDKDGRYDGTETARKMIYYTCGLEVIELEQFKDLSWEPELASKIMGVNKEPITAKKLSEINICNNTPEVEEKGFINGNYNYQIAPRNGGIGEIQLFVNGKQVKKYNKASLPFKNNVYQLSVAEKEVANYFVSSAENMVTVKATTQEGTMTSRGISLSGTASKKPTANPNMYIVSIGVSNYKGDKLKLGYASKDATDFASAITASAKKLLNTDSKEHINTYVFNTEEGNTNWASKKNITTTLNSIASKATADDILVIFFAGHGVLQSGQRNFYLLTAEASAFELNGVEKDVAISTEELNEWMRNIKANKQLLILDACNSGQAVKNLQELIAKRDVPADQQRALENLKDKTGTFILSASAAGQSAYETSLYGQGLLTYSLLSGIKLGDGLKDSYIDVTKWFNTASDNVRILAKDIGGRQEPQIIGSASFDVGKVDKEVVDGIKLSIKKKIFKRSNFIQDADLLNDDIELTALVDKELNNSSARGKESSLVFVADNTLMETYSIKGRYEIKGNIIIVKANLYKGQKEKLYTIEINGTIDKKEELAKKIVEEVNEWLNNK